MDISGTGGEEEGAVDCGLQNQTLGGKFWLPFILVVVPVAPLCLSLPHCEGKIIVGLVARDKGQHIATLTHSEHSINVSYYHYYLYNGKTNINSTDFAEHLRCARHSLGWACSSVDRSSTGHGSTLMELCLGGKTDNDN